jgi:hypothetical protein
MQTISNNKVSVLQFELRPQPTPDEQIKSLQRARVLDLSNAPISVD